MASPWQTLLACSTEAQEVVIVAPYMKASMLRRLLDNLAPDAAVECFTRWTPHDILVGSSDTACRTAVIQRGGTFYLHNRLHAKYYRFNNQTLVGSANVTRAGLNYQEAGIWRSSANQTKTSTTWASRRNSVRSPGKSLKTSSRFGQGAP